MPAWLRPFEFRVETYDNHRLYACHGHDEGARYGAAQQPSGQVYRNAPSRHA